MAEKLLINDDNFYVPDANQLITEDDVYELRGRRYFQKEETWLEQVGLGLTLWGGEFEGRQDIWLRWCYQDGSVVPTGDERAIEAEQRARLAEQLAQQLAERLRALGIDPDSL
jgi:hypothetical protein